MTTERPQIWLVRHGETEWTLSGQHTGRTDIPLTAAGRRQAEALGRHLAARSFALVLTSPLARARETCRFAGHGSVAQITDDLPEWDYGIYEGRTTAAIRAVAPSWSIWSGPIPEGESIEQVGARAGRVIDRALAAGGEVALVRSRPHPADPRRVLDRPTSCRWPPARTGPGIDRRPRLGARDPARPAVEPGVAV